MGDFRFSLRHGDDDTVDYNGLNLYEPFVSYNGTNYIFGILVPNPNFDEEHVSDDPNWDSSNRCKYALAEFNLNLTPITRP